MAQSAWVPSPGRIVRAAVQYSDSEQTKSRYPVVVSSVQFNRRYPEIVVAFTTREKNIRGARAYDVGISERHQRFRETGLTESTTVRCGRLWTLDQRKIVDVIGVLPDDVWADVARLVGECFTDNG